MAQQNQDQAGPLMISFRGKTVELPQLDRGDLEAAEKHLRSMMPSPIDAILRELPKVADYPELRQALASKAAEEVVAQGRIRIGKSDAMAWVRTLDGALWALKRALSKRFQGVTDDEVNEAFDAMIRQKEEAADAADAPAQPESK